jgi:hypothetical protein
VPDVTANSSVAIGHNTDAEARIVCTCLGDVERAMRATGLGEQTFVGWS